METLFSIQNTKSFYIMVKHWLITGLCVLTIFSCIPTRKLDDDTGRGTKVPYQGYKFANQNKFDSSIYQVIDPDYFYELVGIYWVDRNFKEIRDGGPTMIQVLQFYPNGKVRRFGKPDMSPDPEKKGLRGIIYKKGNIIKTDFFEGISDGGMKIRTYQVKVEENRLYLLNYVFLNPEIWCLVYEKKEKVPEEWKQYKPDW